jgi:hypothetical protein
MGVLHDWLWLIIELASGGSIGGDLLIRSNLLKKISGSALHGIDFIMFWPASV